jgi:twitching motility protein PilT
VNLLDSLLDAIIRLGGESLVMHVGERPYVVTTSNSLDEFRGPLSWGQVELSSRPLTTDGVLSMLGQMLPPDARRVLDDVGAVEHEIDSPDGRHRFVVVAARGGDDVWVEVRRKVEERPPVMAPAPEPVIGSEVVAPAEAASDEASDDEITLTFDEPATASTREVEPEVEISIDVGAEDFRESDGWFSLATPEQPKSEAVQTEAVAAPEPVAREESEPVVVPAPEPVAVEPEPVFVSAPEPVAAAEPEPVVIPAPEPVAEAEPVVVPAPELVAEAEPEPVVVPAPEPVAEVEPEPVVVPAPEPVAEAEPEPAVVPAPEPVAEVEPEPVVVPVPEPVAEAEPEPVVVPAPEPVAEAEPEPVVVPAPELVAEVEPEPVVVPKPEPTAADPPPVMRLQPRDPAPVNASTSAVADVLRDGLERGASTVYAIGGLRPLMRIEGDITSSTSLPVLQPADIDRFAFEFAPRGEVAHSTSEWTTTVPGAGRVRCVSFEDATGRGLVFHLAANISSADSLGLSREIQALCTEPDGLVIVAGPRASGKSTLLGAFVDRINRSRADHIITIESRVRTLHERRHSLISQREVDGDGLAIARAARAALREGPDVLIIDDARAPETIAVAIDAARAGRLVFASLPAPSTAAAIERLADAFTVDRRPQIRALLSGALRAVISQVLVRRSDGGRIAAREVLLSSPPVVQLIVDGNYSQVPVAIESGRRLGMRTFTDSLAGLVRDGLITADEAMRAAPDRRVLLAAMRQEGMDVSELEKRA